MHVHLKLTESALKYVPLQEYQRSLGPMGEHLNGSIAILEVTSKIVDIFTDLRPVKDTSDIRLHDLQEVSTWFQQWEQAVADSSITKKEKVRSLPSRETLDDIQSMAMAFLSLCEEHFHHSTETIIAGRINSDICENMFCQQRAMCHGANDNPNHCQYAHGLNTIILSQAPISRKSNAFGSVDPVSFDCSPVNDSCKRIKF